MKNFDSLRNIFGGVISKLLSEVMTASGWRHDKQKRRKRSLDFPVYNRILSLKEVA